MLVPLVVLATGAVVAGIVFHGAFIGEGYQEFWKGAICSPGPTTTSSKRCTISRAGCRCCRPS